MVIEEVSDEEDEENAADSEQVKLEVKENSSLGNTTCHEPSKGNKDIWADEDVASTETNHSAAIESKTNSVDPTTEGEKIIETKSETVSETKKVETMQGEVPLSPELAELKESGNDFFKKGQYDDAKIIYSIAIDKLKQLNDKTMQGHLAALIANRGLCSSKLGDCRACIDDCTLALELKPDSLKPLLRRAAAYETMEKYKQGYLDYQRAMSTEHAQMAQEGANRCQRMLQALYGNSWRSQIQNDQASSKSLSDIAPPTQVKPTANDEKLNNDDLFMKAKNLGNGFVKQGAYQKAIECYTQCIELCPDQAVAYNNRSLCHLKLEKFEDAVSDCSEALKREPKNIKALFRRAQAYKMLKKYSESLNDLRLILSVDSKNAAAENEIEIVNQLKDAEAKEKPRQKIQIEEVEASDDEEEEQEETKSTKSNNSQETSSSHKNSTLPTTEPVKPAATVNTKTPSANSTASQNSNNVNGSSTTSHVQQLNKNSPYEFMQAWGALKQSVPVEPYCQLLVQITPASLPRVISNKLDGHMLHKLIQCTDLLVRKGKGQESYEYLFHLTQVSRFKTISMFMSNAEKQELKCVLMKLQSSKNVTFNNTDIDRLRKAYSV